MSILKTAPIQNLEEYMINKIESKQYYVLDIIKILNFIYFMHDIRIFVPKSIHNYYLIICSLAGPAQLS